MTKQPTRYRVYERNLSDEYGKAPWQLHVYSHNNTRLLVARRTGITCPGYRDRAVYNLDGRYFVYEAGELVDLDVWHNAQEAAS